MSGSSVRVGNVLDALVVACSQNGPSAERKHEVDRACKLLVLGQ
jgi:hypothetical protein